VAGPGGAGTASAGKTATAIIPPGGRPHDDDGMGDRDRVRQLLDAVLAGVEDPAASGTGLAARAYLSRFHFDRLVAAAAGEPPGAFRRRLLLERAAHRLVAGPATVEQVAAEAGYGSAAAFSRAFRRAYGRAPAQFRSSPPAGLRLPAPNGVHFHPPGGLRLPRTRTRNGMDTIDLMLDHDAWMTGRMLELAEGLDDDRLDRPITVSVGHPERDGGLEGVTAPATLRSLLAHLVWTKEMWIAAVQGRPAPAAEESLADLRRRHADAAPRFAALVRAELGAGRGDETFIDATCEPPESFTYAGMTAHVLTYSAYRRTLAAAALLDAGISELGTGNPIGFSDGTGPAPGR